MIGKKGVARVFAGALVGGLLAGSLAGCAPAPTRPKAAHRDTLLTVSKAGERYLQAVCPLNKLWQNTEVEIDALRLTVSRGTPEAARVLKAFTEISTATDTAIASFQATDVRWPKKMQKDIPALVRSLENDKKQLAELAEATPTEIANYSWKGAEETVKASTAARAALGLPEDPATACAAWEEQQRLLQEKAKEDAKKKSADESDSASKTDDSAADSGTDSAG